MNTSHVLKPETLDAISIDIYGCPQWNKSNDLLKIAWSVYIYCACLAYLACFVMDVLVLCKTCKRLRRQKICLFIVLFCCADSLVNFVFHAVDPFGYFNRLPVNLIRFLWVFHRIFISGSFAFVYDLVMKLTRLDFGINKLVGTKVFAFILLNYTILVLLFELLIALGILTVIFTVVSDFLYIGIILYVGGSFLFSLPKLQRYIDEANRAKKELSNHSLSFHEENATKKQRMNFPRLRKSRSGNRITLVSEIPSSGSEKSTVLKTRRHPTVSISKASKITKKSVSDTDSDFSSYQVTSDSTNQKLQFPRKLSTRVSSLDNTCNVSPSNSSCHLYTSQDAKGRTQPIEKTPQKDKNIHVNNKPTLFISLSAPDLQTSRDDYADKQHHARSRLCLSRSECPLLEAFSESALLHSVYISNPFLLGIDIKTINQEDVKENASHSGVMVTGDECFHQQREALWGLLCYRNCKSKDSYELPSLECYEKFYSTGKFCEMKRSLSLPMINNYVCNDVNPNICESEAFLPFQYNKSTRKKGDSVEILLPYQDIQKELLTNEIENMDINPKDNPFNNSDNISCCSRHDGRCESCASAGKENNSTSLQFLYLESGYTADAEMASVNSIEDAEPKIPDYKEATYERTWMTSGLQLPVSSSFLSVQRLRQGHILQKLVKASIYLLVLCVCSCASNVYTISAVLSTARLTPTIWFILELLTRCTEIFILVISTGTAYSMVASKNSKISKKKNRKIQDMTSLPLVATRH